MRNLSAVFRAFPAFLVLTVNNCALAGDCNTGAFLGMSLFGCGGTVVISADTIDRTTPYNPNDGAVLDGSSGSSDPAIMHLDTGTTVSYFAAGTGTPTDILGGDSVTFTFDTRQDK